MVHRLSCNWSASALGNFDCLLLCSCYLPIHALAPNRHLLALANIRCRLETAYFRPCPDTKHIKSHLPLSLSDLDLVRSNSSYSHYYSPYNKMDSGVLIALICTHFLRGRVTVDICSIQTPASLVEGKSWKLLIVTAFCNMQEENSSQE